MTEENCEKVIEKFLPVEDNEKENKKKSCCSGWRKYSGLLLALCSGFLYASVGLIVKYLKDYHVFTLGVFRFTGMILPALLVLVVSQFVNSTHKEIKQDNNEIEKNENDSNSIFQLIWPPTEPKKLRMLAVLFGRGFVGFGAITCHFVSIQHMPVADAMVIGSCSTVFVAVVAHIFLGEKCGVIPILSAVLSMIGVGIIVKPPFITSQENFDQDILIGTCFALSRLVFNSFAIVFVRYLRGVNASLVLVVIGFIQLIQSAGAGVIFGVLTVPTPLTDWVLLLTLGAFSWGTQMSLTMALKSEQAGAFTIFRSGSDTIFAFVLQFIFLGVAPDLYSVVGALVVVTAVILTVARKWVSALPVEHKSRKTYSFLLK